MREHPRYQDFVGMRLDPDVCLARTAPSISPSKDNCGFDTPSRDIKVRLASRAASAFRSRANCHATSFFKAKVQY